ncbi:MAG: hypothetical protein Fur005_21980 [Roseiflexaceae bacterium]
MPKQALGYRSHVLRLVLVVMGGWYNQWSATRLAAQTVTIWYVRADATAPGTGTSWAAFPDLQQALAAASSGQEIWVAAGTYYPTSTSDREASFILKSGWRSMVGLPATNPNVLPATGTPTRPS